MKKIITLMVFLLSVNASAQTYMSPTETLRLGYIETIHSDILDENRTLNIYMPQDFNDTVQYAVVYVLDGGMDEDFIHLAGLMQYYSFPWINRIPPCVVVGIANTNRKRDFTFPSSVERYARLVPGNGGSAAFITFLEKEVQPFIEKKYHGTGTKILIGQSLGGLLATEILFTKPMLFNKYIIISPSLWWDDGSLLKRNPAILGKWYDRQTDIYIGVGKEGSIDGSENHIMEKDAKLLYEKIKASKSDKVKAFFDYMPEEDHATSSHPAVFNAIKLLFPKVEAVRQ